MFYPERSVFIIAEAGVNHNGSMNLARKLIDAAKSARADAIKFQTFDPAALTTERVSKAGYQKQNTDVAESQQEMLKKLVLDKSSHYDLKRYAEDSGLMFLSTAFDVESLKFLDQELSLKILKIASGEVTNGPLLLDFALTGSQLILSTGMSTEEEVRNALAVLAFGYVGYGAPSLELFATTLESDKGQYALRQNVTLLHCTTQYPTPFDGVNLKAIKTLKDVFKLRVGYSDHTLGTAVAPAAVAMGARVIEKHITLDKTLEGPDHQASLDPNEFKDMVEEIRLIETSLGNGEKAPDPCELENRSIARKSLVATRQIQRGSEIRTGDVTAKRATRGRSPMEYWDLIGTPATKDFEYDDPF